MRIARLSLVCSGGESESATLEPRFQLRYVILMGVFFKEHWESRSAHPLEVDSKLLRCRWLRGSCIHFEARLVQIKVSSGAATEQPNFAVVQCIMTR